MFSEVVKLIPSIDKAGLNRMFQTLNQRFASVAKKFSSGMKGALKLGGLAAIGGALLAKVLNPLEKAEEIINRITGKGDDAATTAQELETTPGKVLRLEALAQTKGVDSDTVRMLLGKFQSALADEKEALKADPNAEPGTLRAFVGETDMADAFFKFIQAIQGLDKSRQVVIQNEVFGEKVRGKASEFFNATDFEAILRKLPSVESLTAAAEKSGALADLMDFLRAKRDSEDFVRKSGLVDESQIKAIDQSEKMKLRAEDETLRRFDSLKSTSIAVQELTHKFDTLATDIMKELAPKLITALEGLTLIATEMMPIITQAKDLAMEGFDKTIQAVVNMQNWIGTLWNEFKQSRLYKFVGGGN